MELQVLSHTSCLMSNNFPFSSYFLNINFNEETVSYSKNA